MNGKLGIAGRLFVVLACMAIAHLGARLVSFAIENTPYQRNMGYTYHWYGYYADDWIDHFFYHVFGAAVMFVAIASLVLIWGFIFGAGDGNVDPCQNPKCPCARHVVEREQAEHLRIAAAVSAGIAVGTVIGSGGS